MVHLPSMQNKFPSFVKLPSNRRFSFKPRYYDPQKEELEQRVSRIQREIDAENNGLKDPEALRDKLSTTWRNNNRRSANQKSNMRIAMIAAVLFLVFYFYFLA